MYNTRPSSRNEQYFDSTTCEVCTGETQSGSKGKAVGNRAHQQMTMANLL